jgi:transposase InsO family protein
LPAALQRQVHEVVQETKRRSGWPACRTLLALGVSRRSYYRWLAEGSWLESSPRPPKLVQAYEALPEEKGAVVAYALKHPELRHRELAWRMVDEDIACLSPSTVYRILKERGLLCPWQRRSKRLRTEAEKATHPDQRWSTDLMEVRVQDRSYFFVSFLDDYSRYLVHHELLFRMDGKSVGQAAERALETLERGPDGLPLARPEIRSDNGSGYVSKEFRLVLKAHGLGHHRITPHCPEEKDHASRCTSSVVWEGTSGNRLRSTSFWPGFLEGRSSAFTGSNRYWCLSL